MSMKLYVIVNGKIYGIDYDIGEGIGYSVCYGIL